MTPLPACCTPLNAHWPLPIQVPGTVLLSTIFDSTLLIDGDFQRSAVPLPVSIQRSIVKRQAEFLIGRLCARAALQKLDQLDYVPALGKDRAPVWPEHISGSITHNTGHAAAIVGHKTQWCGLGVDLENVLTINRAECLAEEILTTNELLRMATLPHEQIALLVTMTFSVKESLFKALYPIVQKHFYFEHAEVLKWSQTGLVQLQLLKDLSTTWFYGRKLEGQFAISRGQLFSLVAIGA
ncbi:4'-phosphopantetheinyl transferase family protein [Candidatus Pseudomonas adelgestsugas]|uniref:Enterobactin synthase component D n=1 Tax=Candidatus Pseudomonas adelgestsugas TaxID=1302376 RepID=A0ABX5R966_9PSED|nr:4'-phosphopantetheinyl transferase superfamily protein [Candidatus Pseudomonas adelgestsugas]QAX82194.1 4'-phosphopantetheinyl transferase Npt [Candidatus Pseudomonas adelgestsugas]